MEDEPEICRDGDKGRLWLTLLNEASRQGVPSLSACLDLAQCDVITARGRSQKRNEWRDSLCLKKKEKKKKHDTNFLCLTTVEFCSYTFPKYSPVCLAHLLTLPVSPWLTHTINTHAAIAWFHFSRIIWQSLTFHCCPLHFQGALTHTHSHTLSHKHHHITLDNPAYIILLLLDI